MEIILTFHNTHGVITAEKAMLKEEIAVQVTEIPSSISAGCGLCLRLAKLQLEHALKLLTVHGVVVQAVYVQAQGAYHKIEGSNVYEDRTTKDI